ncbi:MAG TPA: DUF4255 domain-containing protein [Kofleriaceae bacterium]|nr:DUF4255 domain-containing protein [Kofleriaceae bacterium]
MSGATALALVSESLRNLLIGEMSIVPDVPVTLLPPDQSSGNRRVNLFLYKTAINATLRNLDWRVKPGDGTRLVAPPLSLNLTYLMTATAPNDEVTGETTAQELLGEAMRVFHQFPVIPGTYLSGDLQTASEEIRVVLENPDLHELSSLWNTFGQPYRLAVVYQVTVVQIDPSSATERPMPGRVRQVGVPEIRAPFAPPEIAAISPVSGPPGTVVTVTGHALDGWRAYARMSGRTLLDAQPITGDSFTVTVPAGLITGFHELRIDVSRLLRKTLFFEVTP